MVRDEIKFIICYIAEQPKAENDPKQQNSKFTLQLP